MCSVRGCRTNWCHELLHKNGAGGVQSRREKLAQQAGDISFTPRSNAARGMAVTLHTSLGDIKIELFCDRAPKSCENFLALAASSYYDNTTFHRNIKGLCSAAFRTWYCMCVSTVFAKMLRAF